MNWSWAEFIREIASPKGAANVALWLVTVVLTVGGRRLYRRARTRIERTISTAKANSQEAAALRWELYRERIRLARASKEDRNLLFAEGNYLEIRSWLLGATSYALLVTSMFSLGSVRSIPLGFVAVLAKYNSLRFQYASAQFLEPAIASMSDEEKPLALTDTAMREGRAGRYARSALFKTQPSAPTSDA